jgi:hypothetical protein
MPVTNQRAQTYLVVGVVCALAFGGLGFALLRGGSKQSAASGNRDYPKQVVPPKGLPIGQAIPRPSNQRAEFGVQVPSAVGPASTFPGEGNLDVFPSQVTTLKTKASDGTNAGAAFSHMGGVVVVHGVAYVMTEGAVIAVDLKSGTFRTLAGSPTNTGCATGADPSAVRFKGPAGDVATDGHDLFVADGCGISKVSLLNGATSLVEPWFGALTIGPDGDLYAASDVGGKRAIMQIDPANGASKTYVALPSGSYVLGIAADAQSLWASVDEGPSLPTVVDRIGFTDGAITRYAMEGVDVLGAGQLLSAGLYLYAPSVGNLGVLRFAKPNGGWGLTVGGTAGDTDGAWSVGSFGEVRGVASDGHDLWVTDAGNSQLRQVSFSQAAGLGLGG